MKYDDRQASWQNPRVLGLLLLIFLVGAASGAVVMRVAVRWSQATTTKLEVSKNRDLTLKHFQKELNLSPTQTQQVQVILDDFLKYMQVSQDQMDDTRAVGKERIMRVLNDEQKAKFEKLMSELQKPGH